MLVSAITEIELKCVTDSYVELSQITQLFNNGSFLALKNGRLFEMKYCREFTMKYLLPLICFQVAFSFLALQCVLLILLCSIIGKRKQNFFHGFILKVERVCTKSSADVQVFWSTYALDIWNLQNWGFFSILCKMCDNMITVSSGDL